MDLQSYVQNEGIDWGIWRTRFRSWLRQWISSEGGSLPLLGRIPPPLLPRRELSRAGAILDFIFVSLARNLRDTVLWEFLGVMPRLILAPVCTPTRRWRIRERLALFVKGEFEVLQEGYLASSEGTARRARAGNASSLSARVQRLVAVGDLSRAARVLEGQAPVLPYDASLDQTVSDLFPSADVDLQPEFESFLDRPELARFGIDLTMKESDLEDLLRTSRRGRCPGPSGLRTEVLQALSNAGQGALVKILNALFQGAGGTSAPWNHLRRAQLCLLTKPDHEAARPRLRPIGMVECLRKLAGRWICQRLRQRVSAFLAPLQVGVGFSGGCELITHAIELERASRPDWGVLVVDFRNAFNSVSRTHALEAMRKVFPEAWPFLSGIYGGGSLPYWTTAGTVFEAHTGVQQGDPCGPVLHACALQLVLLRLATEVPDLRICAYHDDVTLLGTPETLAQGLTHIEEIARGVGLVVEPTKCSFLRPRDVPLASLPSRLRLIGEREGLEHHGVGLGSANFVEDSCERVLARQKKLTDAIERLPESMLQSACLLSRFCAGPRLNYWLRSLPPRWGEWIAAKADAMQLKHWGTLLDEPLDLDSAPDRDLIRAQLALPLRLGGFGVADRGLVCSPAVVASWATALRTLVSFRMRSACLLARALTSDDPVTLPPPLLSIYDGLQQAFSKCNAVPDENRSRFRSWKELLRGRAEASEDSPIDRVLADEGGANPGSPVADYPGLSRLWSSRTDVIQHSLTWGQHSAAHAILLNSPLTPPTTAARLRGMGSHLSHLWLTTLPSSLGHRLDAFQFRSAARIYLGLPQAPWNSNRPSFCQGCESRIDACGTHFLGSCGLLRGLRTRRHTRFKYILSEFLTRVGHTVEVESELPSSDPDAAPPRCIADLLVSDVAARRSAYVDLAITCPVASAHLTAAARRRGAAACAARRVKERRYAESMASLPNAERRSHRFQPFIVESFGHVDKSGLEWLRKCFAEHPVEYLELLRRLSVSLWRYSSSMLAQARHRRLGLHASLPSS